MVKVIKISYDAFETEAYFRDINAAKGFLEEYEPYLTSWELYDDFYKVKGLTMDDEVYYLIGEIELEKWYQ